MNNFISIFSVMAAILLIVLSISLYIYVLRGKPEIWKRALLALGLITITFPYLLIILDRFLIIYEIDPVLYEDLKTLDLLIGTLLTIPVLLSLFTLLGLGVKAAGKYLPGAEKAVKEE